MLQGNAKFSHASVQNGALNYNTVGIFDERVSMTALAMALGRLALRGLSSPVELAKPHLF